MKLCLHDSECNHYVYQDNSKNLNCEVNKNVLKNRN